jgi:hypothetical protein
MAISEIKEGLDCTMGMQTTLSQQLEHVSQEKVFGSNLSLVQELMRSQLDDMWMDSWRDLIWEEMSEPSVRKS